MSKKTRSGRGHSVSRGSGKQGVMYHFSIFGENIASKAST
jgi:hypothetical protein